MRKIPKRRGYTPHASLSFRYNTPLGTVHKPPDIRDILSRSDPSVILRLKEDIKDKPLLANGRRVVRISQNLTIENNLSPTEYETQLNLLRVILSRALPRGNVGSKNGWMRIKDILSCPEGKEAGFTFESIQTIVNVDDFGRFLFNEGKTKIKLIRPIYKKRYKLEDNMAPENTINQHPMIVESTVSFWKRKKLKYLLDQLWLEEYDLKWVEMRGFLKSSFTVRTPNTEVVEALEEFLGKKLWVA